MKLHVDYAGLKFRITADVENDCVEYVSRVEVMATTGKYVPVKYEVDDFLDGLQDYLNDAIEEAILDEQLAHGDMLFETAREEGKL